MHFYYSFVPFPRSTWKPHAKNNGSTIGKELVSLNHYVENHPLNTLVGLLHKQ